MPRGLGLRAAFAAVALLCAAVSARADDPPASTSALTIVSRSPDAEFRIRGVSLKAVRADDEQNTVSFAFNGPVSDEAFTRLQDELPDWIEMSYAGYDNAIIRARRPVTFLTKAEADGFSMRMVARGDGGPALRGGDGAPPPPPAPLRDAHGWKQVQHFLARSAAERPGDAMLRSAYDAVRTGGVSYVAISGDWRHTSAATLYTGHAHAEIGAWWGMHLLADVHDVNVNATAVRRFSGAITPYNRNDVSASAGLALPLDGAVMTAEALYGRSGWGGRLGLTLGDEDLRLGMRAAYHEPYTDTAEALSLYGRRDYSAVFASARLFDTLWATGEVRGTRYGAHGDDSVARTLGWHGGLRYDVGGWPISLTYDGEGEYVLSKHTYIGVPPTPFVPLSIRDREVHSFGGDFADAWDNQFWFDLYGGWSIDRYANSGPYGGVALRFTPASGVDLALNGRYATVAERQGDQGDEISAGLQLTFAWGGDAPIMHAGL